MRKRERERDNGEETQISYFKRQRREIRGKEKLKPANTLQDYDSLFE